MTKSELWFMGAVMAAVLGCGDVSTAAMAPDGGDAGGGAGGSTGAAGATGSGGTGGCERGTERCDCYGNQTCNDGLACLSNVCVAPGGAGGRGGASGGSTGTAGAGQGGRGGSSGTGNTVGTGGTGTGNVSGGAGANGSGGTTGSCMTVAQCPLGANACINGVCGCLGGAMLCGTTCIDTNTSTSNCGGCNQPCTGGSCTNGVCVRP